MGKRILYASILCIACVSVVKADYTNGILILNEDWYGHNESSMNYYDYSSETMAYRVFKTANNSKKYLGNTSQYACVYGEHIYIMSKQNYGEDASTGGRLIVADAKTLSQIASIQSLDGKDGRAFVGVNPEVGYVGTSGGIYLFDLTQNILGAMIAGTGADGEGLYSDQIGDMVRYRDYVFAAKQGVGLLVINTHSHKVVQTIELPNITTVFVTFAGDLYAATTDTDAEFVKIEPDDFSLTPINIDATAGSACVWSSWGAWRSGSVAADPVENSIYYYNEEYAKNIIKYNFDTHEFISDFITLPQGVPDENEVRYDQVMYATGVSINPVTRELLLTTTEEGWTTHFSKNWMHFVDVEIGEITKTVELDSHYWFPAMAVYPDNYSPVFELSPISISLGSEYNLDLTQIASDVDDNDHLIIMSATIDNNGICEISQVEYGKYVITPLLTGNATLYVTADSKGRLTTKEIAVSVSSQAGVTELSSNSDIRINYTNGRLMILNADGCDACLYDISGVEIDRFFIEGCRSERQYSIGQGLYVLRVKDKVFKLIITD